MRTYIKQSKAFSMLELIMVIVILGIVASIGSSIIANIYENYVLQKAIHNSSLKTELAAQQIANLLSYRVRGTTLARNPDDLSDNYMLFRSSTAKDNKHTVIEWVGSDADGFSSTLLPAWNGFCDIEASSQTSVVTPGSSLDIANSIMANLSNNAVSLDAGEDPSIFFRHQLYAKESNNSVEVLYKALSDDGTTGCMGIVDADTSCISTVTRNGKEVLDFSGAAAGTSNKVIAEHYKLSWTSYAIRPVKTKSNELFDLVLYTNYRPWEGTRLSGGWPATSSTIIKNVSVFKFTESGNTLRFKICAQESIGGEFNITSCKEKAV
jgi:prepilin-type N-terminal cleavage/methylation domain-containing protein